MPRNQRPMGVRDGGCRDEPGMTTKRRPRQSSAHLRYRAGTPTHHFCAMVIDALGNWALIEGEYIASTRVDGMLNVPAPLRRIR